MADSSWVRAPPNLVVVAAEGRVACAGPRATRLAVVSDGHVAAHSTNPRRDCHVAAARRIARSSDFVIARDARQLYARADAELRDTWRTWSVDRVRGHEEPVGDFPVVSPSATRRATVSSDAVRAAQPFVSGSAATRRRRTPSARRRLRTTAGRPRSQPRLCVEGEGTAKSVERRLGDRSRSARRPGLRVRPPARAVRGVRSKRSLPSRRDTWPWLEQNAGPAPRLPRSRRPWGSARIDGRLFDERKSCELVVLCGEPDPREEHLVRDFEREPRQDRAAVRFGRSASQPRAASASPSAIANSASSQPA